MKSHTFKGPTSGFVVTYTFDDLKDTQGYVGYLPSDSSIYVVFRGSSSIQNWITNLEVTKTAYKGSCCGKSCQIHRGFYEAGDLLYLFLIFYLIYIYSIIFNLFLLNSTIIISWNSFSCSITSIKISFLFSKSNRSFSWSCFISNYSHEFERFRNHSHNNL